jgi:hypothetical protein
MRRCGGLGKAVMRGMEIFFLIRLISTTVSVNIKMYLVKSLDWPFNSKHDRKKEDCLKAKNVGVLGGIRSYGDGSLVEGGHS